MKHQIVVVETTIPVLRTKWALFPLLFYSSNWSRPPATAFPMLKRSLMRGHATHMYPCPYPWGPLAIQGLVDDAISLILFLCSDVRSCRYPTRMYFEVWYLSPMGRFCGLWCTFVTSFVMHARSKHDAMCCPLLMMCFSWQLENNFLGWPCLCVTRDPRQMRPYIPKGVEWRPE